MNVFQGAVRAVTKTADATTAAAGAVGGAAVNGVIGGVQGVATGLRNGASSGSHSTAAAALTLGAIGAVGLVEWPVLLAVGGTALVVHQLANQRNGNPSTSSPSTPAVLLQQANELRRQGRKRRFRYRTLGKRRCPILLVSPRGGNAPSRATCGACGCEPRPRQCLFDAETEAAQWQSIGAHEHNEVGVGTALAGGVDRVKFTLAEQARLARKRLATLRR